MAAETIFGVAFAGCELCSIAFPGEILLAVPHEMLPGEWGGS